MPSVDLDSPEHAICSHALERARETLTARTVSWHRAVKRAEKAEAEVERLAQRALDAEQARDRAIAEELRLRAAIAEVIEDWKEQAVADENGWSYRRGNNTFNEGAAYVLRHTLPELEEILTGGSS